MSPTTHFYARLFVFVWAFGCFFNSRNGDFVWDDRGAILGNKDVTDPSFSSDVWKLFENDFWGKSMKSKTSHKSWRPLTVISFRANFLWHGYTTMPYHLVNIVAHCVNSVLVYQLATSLAFPVASAFASAMIFAAHPVHSDSVASIVGRADVIACTFAIVALILYIRACRRGSGRGLVSGKGDSDGSAFSFLFLTGAVLLACISLACKELGATYLGVMVAYDILWWWCCRGVQSETDMKGKGRILPALPSQGATVETSIVGMRTGVVFAATAMILKFRLSLHGPHPSFPWTAEENHIAVLPFGLSKVLSIAHTHVAYLQLLLFPYRLSFDWGMMETPLITGLWDIQNVLSAVTYGALIYWIAHCLQRQRFRHLMSLALFGISFLPVSHIFFKIGVVIGERVMYIPSVGFCLACGLLLFPAGGDGSDSNEEEKKCGEESTATWQESLSEIRSSQGHVRIFTFLVIVALLTCRTVIRNADWRTEESLYGSAVKHAPRSLRALNNHAALYVTNKARAQESVMTLRRSIQLRGYLPTQYSNLGRALATLGRTEEAVVAYRDGLAKFPRDPNLNSHLANVLLGLAISDIDPVTKAKYINEARQRSLFIVENKRGFDYHQNKPPLPYYILGTISLDHDVPRNLSRAKKYLLEALPLIDLDNGASMGKGDLYNQLGRILSEQGEADEAIAYFQKGLKHSPNNWHLLSNLASQLLDKGEAEKSVRVYERALKLETASGLLYNNVAWAYEHLHKYGVSLQYYEKALHLLPTHPTLINNRNSCMQKYQAALAAQKP